MGDLGEHERRFFDTIVSMMRWSSAGESHGRHVIAFIEGIPAGVEVSTHELAEELRRRRTGYGRGARQQFEQDECTFISGVRHGRTLGSPIAIEIHNSEWPKWEAVMNPDPVAPAELYKSTGRGDSKELARNARLTRPRPGHADYAGVQKFGFSDIRNVLERASARETVARVAAGYVAKKFLAQVADIAIVGHVVEVGSEQAATAHPIVLRDRPQIEESSVRCADPAVAARFIAEIDAAKSAGDTLGGVVEVVAWNVPVGVGTYTVWKDRLDSRLAASLMSIPAVKGVEIGDGFASARRRGSAAHDHITRTPHGIERPTNHAGGIEGGMSNGEPIVARIAVKPIATVPRALRTVDLSTGEESTAIHQRSDTTAVVPAAVIAEAMMALTLAEAVLERSAGDQVADVRAHYDLFARSQQPDWQGAK